MHSESAKIPSAKKAVKTVDPSPGCGEGRRREPRFVRTLRGGKGIFCPDSARRKGGERADSQRRKGRDYREPFCADLETLSSSEA